MALNSSSNRRHKRFIEWRSNGLIYELTDGQKHLIFLTEKGKKVVELIVSLSKLEVKSE